jgi:hypothetical protein
LRWCSWRTPVLPQPRCPARPPRAGSPRWLSSVTDDPNRPSQASPTVIRARCRPILWVARSLRRATTHIKSYIQSGLYMTSTCRPDTPWTTAAQLSPASPPSSGNDFALSPAPALRLVRQPHLV